MAKLEKISTYTVIILGDYFDWYPPEIGAQRNIVGFIVEGHIYSCFVEGSDWLSECALVDKLASKTNC